MCKESELTCAVFEDSSGWSCCNSVDEGVVLLRLSVILVDASFDLNALEELSFDSSFVWRDLFEEEGKIVSCMVEEDLSSALVSFVESIFRTTVVVDEEGMTVNCSFGIEAEGIFELTPFLLEQEESF